MLINSNDIILIIFAAVSLVLLIPHLSWKSSLIIVCIGFIGFSILKNIILAICIALIIGNIVVSLIKAGQIQIELFENKHSKPNKKQKDEKDSDEQIESDEKEETDEKFEDSKEESEDFYIDTKGSFKDNLQSLTPKEISALNKDTKDLINTQKQLLDTLTNMKPALADGKKILDSFKDYFGKDDKALADMLKNYK
jgi:hypothetical protein